MNQVIEFTLNATGAPSIVLAQGHTLMRRGLIALLNDVRPDWVCDDVEDLDQLHASIRQTAPSMVVIHLPLCGLNGLRALRGTFPHATFVVLADDDDRATILACLEAGAQGYIVTSTSPDRFVRSLETVLSGGLVAPASLSGTPIHPPVPVSQPEPRLNPALTHLTERQRHVFELLAEGCATKTIARRLDLAVGTVKVHLAAIYRVLGASSRLEALAKAHGGYATA